MRNETILGLQIVLTLLEIVAIILNSQILLELFANTAITKRNGKKLDEIKEDSQRFS